MPAVASGESKIGKQFWNAAIENGPVIAAGFMAKRAGKPAFAGPWRSSVILPGIKVRRATMAAERAFSDSFLVKLLLIAR
jgi:hypothetical protein